MDQLADPVRTKLADGTRCSRSAAGSAGSRSPPRSPTGRELRPGTSGGCHRQTFGSEFRLDPVTPGTVNTFHEDLDAAVGALGRPADSVRRRVPHHQQQAGLQQLHRLVHVERAGGQLARRATRSRRFTS